MPREWTTQDLQQYVSTFGNEYKEAVVKVILESDILEQWLSTTEGRLVVNNQVDSIASLLGKIIGFCKDGIEKHKDEVNLSALKINLSFEFLYGIASMTVGGEQHKAAMKKTKGQQDE